MKHNTALSGKVLLITGAARRIGAEIVRTLHAEGMNIALHYRNSREEAEALQQELEAIRPDSVSLVQADLLHTNELPGLVKQTVERWGRLDVLINNASTFYSTPVGGITEDDWDLLVGSNLKAPLFLTQAASPELAIHKGCIINIIDIHAFRPLKGYPVYSAAKAGLKTLTESMARELGPDIRVNGVAPGAILWPEQEEPYGEQHKEIIQRTALKREGSPEDIAKTVLFLVKDAPYITGQIIPVDGGRMLAH
ncbi:MAG: pteridine reductase [Gammaproteobacteria bacterium]|nr:pteridine reductase [Gammaproteobacteria bacterium]